jgi:hypothetical protein
MLYCADAKQKKSERAYLASDHRNTTMTKKTRFPRKSPHGLWQQLMATG